MDAECLGKSVALTEPLRKCQVPPLPCGRQASALRGDTEAKATAALPADQTWARRLPMELLHRKQPPPARPGWRSG